MEHNSIWHSVIYQSKHFSLSNANKYILKHLQHTFQLLIYHTLMLYSSNPHCSKYITTFQKTIRLIADYSLIWHFRLPIKTLFAYQRNQIYSEASSTHFSVVNLSYTCALPIIILIDSNKLKTFQKSIWLIAEHSLIWHFRLPIKTLLAYQRNQIYSEASSTHFSAVNLSYFTLYPLNSSWIYFKYPTFQKTIRLIADYSLIWHFRLPIKTLFAYQRN